MIRNSFLIKILLFINIFYSEAQDNIENPITFAIKPQYGIILPHSEKIEHLTHTNPFGIEIDYSWLMLKDKNWQQCNCYSKTGISFLYINFNNPEIVGSSYSLIGFAEPFLIRSNKILVSSSMGFGITYLNKIYDIENNPENTFFSTHLSFIAYIDLNIYLKLSNKYSLITFAKYNHISNGGVKQPNYGMNFPTFGLGLTYYPDWNNKFPERDKRVFKPFMFYNLYVFGMIKKIQENEYFPEKTTQVFGFYGVVGRTVSILNGLSIGLEYLNDGGAKEEIYRSGLSYDYQRVSALVGHHLLFGKFDFSQFWGTYIYAPYKPRNFFQRYSLTRQFAKHIEGGVTLKAHGDIADSFQILIGVSF